jgi:hypothetical protein
MVEVGIAARRQSADLISCGVNRASLGNGQTAGHDAYFGHRPFFKDAEAKVQERCKVGIGQRKRDDLAIDCARQVARRCSHAGAPWLCTGRSGLPARRRFSRIYAGAGAVIIVIAAHAIVAVVATTGSVVVIVAAAVVVIAAGVTSAIVITTAVIITTVIIITIIAIVIVIVLCPSGINRPDEGAACGQTQTDRKRNRTKK